MKKILFVALCFIALSSKAQIDTVKGAILVQPLVVNALQKDTVYQLTWTAFGLTRDTGVGCNTYVQFYDRKGNAIHQANCPIPWDTVKYWGTDDAIIDKYILFKFGLTKK